jgi:DNA-binding transcriptional ArsR family regulator
MVENMPQARQDKAYTCRCSPEECENIVKEVNNAFTILTDTTEIQRRAQLFRGLGHEVRLRILGLLAVQELCTCEIVAALESATSTIVHHLRVLAEGGLIASRKVGKFTIFRLNNELLIHHRVFDQATEI